MLRRSSTTGLLRAQVNLGPPLRAIDFNLNGYESEEEGIRDALISVRDQTPATTKAKPTECKDKENKVDNKDSFTPSNKPNPLFSSAGYGKSTSDSTRGSTPSSTFPCFLGNTAENPKETRLRREGLTPSSTLPSSFPPAEYDTTHDRDEYPSVPQPLRVHAPTSASYPRTPTMPPSIRHESETWGTKAQNEFSLPLQNGSLSKNHRPPTQPKHADAPQNRVTSKPPLDHSAAKRQERGQPQRSMHEHSEKPLTLSPEEKETDVVVMRSSHEEKRFKKLKLLGVGGSSRVSWLAWLISLVWQFLLCSCWKRKPWQSHSKISVQIMSSNATVQGFVQKQTATKQLVIVAGAHLLPPPPPPPPPKIPLCVLGKPILCHATMSSPLEPLTKTRLCVIYRSLCYERSKTSTDCRKEITFSCPLSTLPPPPR